MTSIMVPAGELYQVQMDAESAFERSGCSSLVHDVYVRGYVEATMVERHRQAESHRAAEEANQ